MTAKKKVKKTNKKQKRVYHKKIVAKKVKTEEGPRAGYALQPTVHGKLLGVKSEKTSDAGNIRQGGLMSGAAEVRIKPRIEFWKRQEFYLTVGRVQNVTESYVLNIQNREHYYDTTEENDPILEEAQKKMEAWEEAVVVNRFVGNTIRSWIVNGLVIVSPIDWVPMQLQAIESKQRDKKGNTLAYYQRINGVEKRIPANDFIEVPYIDFDREPWPVGMFDSLMNADFLDVDGKDAQSSLVLYRQSLQDNMRIHHKFASPRVIYTAEGVGKEVVDDDITPVLEGMAPGDRAIFNAAIDIKQETVDGNARFIEHVNKIIDEIDTGLQSSANRLITEPSAMADAREANSQDDDRVLGMMERWRIFVNKEIIPRVTGLEPGKVVWKWGAKDAFDLDFPEPLQLAIDKGVVTAQQALLMLETQWHWKFPTEEELRERFGANFIDPAEAQKKALEEPKEDKDTQPKETKKVVEEAIAKVEADIKAKFESSPVESELDIKIKNEKLVSIEYLNEILKGMM